MSEIEYAIAWRRDDEKLIAGAKAFWRTMNLPDEVIADRVPELCALAYAGERVIGLTTVKLGELPRLKCRAGILRCAVAPEFRKHYLATFLTRDSLTILEYWSLENRHEALQGVALVLQSKELGSKAVYPMWADWNTHYNLVGYTAGEEQIRMAWFRHAQLAVR